MKKILVTGGAGFIGSAIVWGLNTLGIDNIIIVDHLGNSDKWKNLRNLKFLDYIEKDIFYNTNSAHPYIFDDIETIFHMGACSSTTEQDMSYLIQNNLKYSQLLAQIAYSKRIRFIYASSAATYGNGMDFSDDLSKLNTLRPLNKYGYSKHMFDCWLLNRGYFNKPGIVGLKYFNVYGPNEYHKGEMKSFILKSVEQLKTTNKISLFSNALRYRRDFIYIKDAVGMTLRCLNDMVSGIFNIGSGSPTSWEDISHNILKNMFPFEANNLLFRQSLVNDHTDLIDMPSNLINQYQTFTHANISKTLRYMDNKNITSIEDGIKEYINDYILQNKYLGD